MLLLPALGLVVWIIYLQGQKREYKWVFEKFSGNSNFGRLQVVDREDGSCRFYLNDNLTQNTYDTDRKQSESQFTYMLAGLARAYTSNITDVLCIGLGVGIVPMDFAHQGAIVDVVEINPAVVPVAVQFFDLETNKIHLAIDDARHFLNRCQKQYDAVVLDAFLGDSSPSHLMTREAFASIRRVLRPGGTLTINSPPGAGTRVVAVRMTIDDAPPELSFYVTERTLQETGGVLRRYSLRVDGPPPRSLPLRSVAPNARPSAAASTDAGVSALIRAVRWASAVRLMDSLVHDVRNPLNALAINVEILQEKLARAAGGAVPPSSGRRRSKRRRPCPGRTRARR
jgi:spermidine synthase